MKWNYKGTKKYFNSCWFSEFISLQILKLFIIFSIGPSWKWEIEIKKKYINNHIIIIFEHLLEFY